MKTLLIVRHAKAAQNMEDLADIDRPLIERGYKDAHAMSKKLFTSGIRPQLIVSSPGIRALSTALIFARNLNFRVKQIVLEEKLYNAQYETALEIIANLPESMEQVMIFGHNPSVTQVCSLFANEMIQHVPTCGVCCVDFQSDSWKNLRPRSGKVRFFDHPKNN